MEKERDKQKYVKRNFKQATKTILSSTAALASVAVGAYVPVIGFPLFMKFGKDALQAARGQYINNSMINVERGNKVVQSLPNMKQLLNGVFTKDKKDFLFMQELNFLLGSDTFDKKGKQIEYKTKSQGLTYMMLKKLQKDGFIEGLKKEPAGQKALILEKVSLMNFSNILKKEKMYNINFKKVDREITEDDIKRALNINLENEKYKVKKDKDGKIKNVDLKLTSTIKGRLDDRKKQLSSKDLPLLEESTAKDEKVTTNFQQELSQQVNDTVTYTEQKIADEKVVTIDPIQK